MKSNNNERQDLINLIKEMGKIIKSLDTENKYLGYHADENEIPYLTDIFITNSQ